MANTFVTPQLVAKLVARRLAIDLPLQVIDSAGDAAVSVVRMKRSLRFTPSRSEHLSPDRWNQWAELVAGRLAKRLRADKCERVVSLPPIGLGAVTSQTITSAKAGVSLRLTIGYDIQRNGWEWLVDVGKVVNGKAS